jgi:hypothetical protein
MRRAGFSAKLAFLCGGLLIWAAHFATVYAVNALACARGLDRHTLFGVAAVPVIVAAATGLAVLACCIILFTALRSRGPGIGDEPAMAVRAFWRIGTASIAAFAVVAIGWTGLPAAMIPPCG